jgi:hypothetical protein
VTPAGEYALDPVTRATQTIEEYRPTFLRHHRVEGNTKDTASASWGREKVGRRHPARQRVR